MPGPVGVCRMGLLCGLLCCGEVVSVGAVIAAGTNAGANTGPGTVAEFGTTLGRGVTERPTRGCFTSPKSLYKLSYFRQMASGRACCEERAMF
jgi:hypothetical protein